MSEQQNKIQNFCLIVITAFVLTVALVYTKSALIPFVISVFVYAISSPGIEWFEKKLKLPRPLAVLLTVGVFLLVSVSMTVMVTSSLQNFIEGADNYREQITNFASSSAEVLKEKGFKYDPERLRSNLRKLPILSVVKNFTGNIVNVISNTVLIIIFTLFMLAGEGVSEIKNPLLRQLHHKISKYAVMKFLVSFSTAFIVGIILMIFNVELAFMFAILTFFLNFIPSVGSIFATLIPIPVLMLQYGVSWQTWVVISLCMSIQFLIGNVLEPKLMGDSMDLHPITILLFLMFWGLVWGIPGMFMAVPITAVLKIVLGRIETTRPMAELMAGRLPHFE